jgi:hypothetical protein
MEIRLERYTFLGKMYVLKYNLNPYYYLPPTLIFVFIYMNVLIILYIIFVTDHIFS